MINGPTDSVLDVGCGYGWTLGRISGSIRNLVGVDVDEDALASASVNYPDIRFVRQTGSSLPFDNESFDVVILSEVIEHVGDTNKLLVINEACRVLKCGGLFIFTAPYDGLFAWTDPMDFKRRFPGVYRLYMRWTSYTPNTAMEIGHKHLPLSEIEALFGDKLIIKHIRYCGLLMPFLTWVLAIDSRIKLLPHKWHSLLNHFRAWESGLRYGPLLSFNIRLVARKTESPR